MYREPHLTKKSKECAIIWEEWYKIFQDKNGDQIKRKELRTQWCQCCDELSEMINQEYLTNSRYKNLKM